jgi:hypothetical protein
VPLRYAERSRSTTPPVHVVVLVAIGETVRAESTIMAMKKKKKKRTVPKKTARTSASKRPTKRTAKSAKKSAAARRPRPVDTKRAVPAKKPAAAPATPPPKAFAEKVRDRDVGTEVWYRVGDAVTRGTIQGAGAAGNVDVLSNGTVSGVPEGDLHETQAAAQAAR